MEQELVFNKVCEEDTFCSEFNELVDNNIVEFPKDGIIIFYAPNGVGKTSLSKVLD